MDTRIERQIKATQWLLEQGNRNQDEVQRLLYRLGLSVLGFSRPMQRSWTQEGKRNTEYNTAYQRRKRARLAVKTEVIDGSE